jgi:hypothetical protein
MPSPEQKQTSLKSNRKVAVLVVTTQEEYDKLIRKGEEEIE